MLLNPLKIVFVVPLRDNNQEGLLPIEEIIECNDDRSNSINKGDEYGSNNDGVVYISSTSLG